MGVTGIQRMLESGCGSFDFDKKEKNNFETRNGKKAILPPFKKIILSPEKELVILLTFH